MIKQFFFLLAGINLFIIITSISKCRGENNNSTNQIRENGRLNKDTLELLADKNVKFWDVFKKNNDSNEQNNGSQNWMFSINKKLIEYSYNKNKRYLRVYGEDVIIGELKIKFNKDTLFIPELSNRKYLIKKLVEDTLIVQQILKIGLKSPIMYLKSKNQTEIPKM